MLIVVLDDDDELVVGKGKQPSSSQGTRSTATNRYTNNNNNYNRSSPSRTQKNSKHKQRNTPPSNRESTNKPYQPSNTNRQQQRERPSINTQKLAQRLHNIKQDQDRHSRGKSPKYDRTTPEKTRDAYDDNVSLRFSQSDPQFHVPLDKPHAKIAKPVERKKKKRRTVRPDPEGAPLDPAEMDELDKLLGSCEPLFSDYGTDDENEKSENTPARPSRGLGLAAFAIGFGLNSNTMIKYTIIGTELQNIIKVSLRMVIVLSINYALLLNLGCTCS